MGMGVGVGVGGGAGAGAGAGMVRCRAGKQRRTEGRRAMRQEMEGRVLHG